MAFPYLNQTLTICFQVNICLIISNGFKLFTVDYTKKIIIWQNKNMTQPNSIFIMYMNNTYWNIRDFHGDIKLLLVIHQAEPKENRDGFKSSNPWQKVLQDSSWTCCGYHWDASPPLVNKKYAYICRVRRWILFIDLTYKAINIQNKGKYSMIFSNRREQSAYQHRHISMNFQNAYTKHTANTST